MTRYQGFACLTITVLTFLHAFADRREQIPLWDRLAEFDSVIVAKASGASVETSIDASSQNKTYWATFVLHPKEFIYGKNLKEIKVIVDTAFSTEKAAKQMADRRCSQEKAIWFLKQEKIIGLGWQMTGLRNVPDKPENWEPYLKWFQKKALELTKYNGLRLCIEIKPKVLLNGIPSQVTVTLYSADNKKIPIPADLQWSSSIRLKIETTKTGKIVKGKLSKLNAPEPPLPSLVILNVRSNKKNISQEIGNNGITAKIFVRLIGYDKMDNFSAVNIIATLVNNQKSTLLKSKPAITIITNPTLQDIDQQAMDAITQQGLWPFLGPQDKKIDLKTLNTLKHMSSKFRRSIFEPAFKCGIAFSENSGFTTEEKIKELKELSQVEYFGWADDCMVELAKTLQTIGRIKEAEEVLKELALRQSASNVSMPKFSTTQPAIKAKKKTEK